MGGVQRRKHSNAKNKRYHRDMKAKHYIKDHDQIHQQIKQQQQLGPKNLQVDQEKPGSGQYYCLSCARFFQSQNTLQQHKKNKRHKRMLKKMLQQPYTHKQAYEAGK